MKLNHKSYRNIISDSAPSFTACSGAQCPESLLTGECQQYVNTWGKKSLSGPERGTKIRVKRVKSDKTETHPGVVQVSVVEVNTTPTNPTWRRHFFFLHLPLPLRLSAASRGGNQYCSNTTERACDSGSMCYMISRYWPCIDEFSTLAISIFFSQKKEKHIYEKVFF